MTYLERDMTEPVRGQILSDEDAENGGRCNVFRGTIEAMSDILARPRSCPVVSFDTGSAELSSSVTREFLLR
jgi:hypothetical protein